MEVVPWYADSVGNTVEAILVSSYYTSWQLPSAKDFALTKSSSSYLGCQLTPHTHTHTPVNRPFVRDYLGELVPEGKNQSGFY